MDLIKNSDIFEESIFKIIEKEYNNEGEKYIDLKFILKEWFELSKTLYSQEASFYLVDNNLLEKKTN